MTSLIDFDLMAAQLSPTLNVYVRSAAPDSISALPRGPYDAVFVIADGEAANAVQAHAVPLVMAVTARLLDWNLGPVVLAEHARVAVGDEIGARMHAAMVVVLIGERAGLDAQESLAAYLTYASQRGRPDTRHHCIANIQAAGASYGAAAEKLSGAMSRGRSADVNIATDDDASDILGPDSIDKLLDSEPGKLRSSKK